MQITADWINAPDVRRLMDVLSQDGNNAYFVGGCVRNSLLGLPITDIDISTDATPDIVMLHAKSAKLKVLPTGIDHGTVTIIMGNQPYEVTTFRKDVSTDGRRAIVEYSKDMQDDAQRRDFTMNAIYADSLGNVIDPLNGLPDLKIRRVRFILDANQRIAEDYLRILRFFRFHAYYGDNDAGMDQEALAACASGCEGLDTLSKERIGSEIRKILLAKNPSQVIATMHQIGILPRILHGSDPKFLPILIHLEQGITPDWLRRLAVLGGANQQDLLRMSKKDTVILSKIMNVIERGGTICNIAYYEGAEIARNAHLVISALTEQQTAPNLEALVLKGDTARGKFPIHAVDLPNLKGQKLGMRLRELEKHWVESDFKKTKQELLT